jgi:hypothetical protein
MMVGKTHHARHHACRTPQARARAGRSEPASRRATGRARMSS